MRVFVTGATGFVGSAIVRELLSQGHQVLGLVRSEAKAIDLAKTGADVHMGNLEDLDSLRAGVAACEAVIHTGFNHDFSKFAENCENDHRAVLAMGEALLGTDKPMMVTSAVGLLSADRSVTDTVTEADIPVAQSPRAASEKAVRELVEKGANVSVVRLPPSTHGAGDHGFVPILINIARQNGHAAYVADGANVWAAVHRFDAARVYRLAMERGVAGSVYHAVAEPGIAFHKIAETIATGLGIEVKSIPADQAAEYFTWFAHFAAMDNRASSDQTRTDLNWSPSEPDLLSDMVSTDYFAAK